MWTLSTVGPGPGGPSNTALRILVFIEKTMEKQWKEFSVEGKGEDITIEFTFQNEHSDCSVETRLIGGQRKAFFSICHSASFVKPTCKL